MDQLHQRYKIEVARTEMSTHPVAILEYYQSKTAPPLDDPVPLYFMHQKWWGVVWRGLIFKKSLGFSANLIGPPNLRATVAANLIGFLRCNDLTISRLGYQLHSFVLPLFCNSTIVVMRVMGEPLEQNIAPKDTYATWKMWIQTCNLSYSNRRGAISAELCGLQFAVWVFLCIVVFQHL